MPVDPAGQHMMSAWVTGTTAGIVTAKWQSSTVVLLESADAQILARLLATLDEMESAAIAAVTTVGDA
jgi:hypothetical protein